MRKIKLAIDEAPGYFEVPLLETFEISGVTMAVTNAIYGGKDILISEESFVVTHFKSGRKIPHTLRGTKEGAIQAGKEMVKEYGIRKLKATDKSCNILNQLEQ